MIHKFYQIILSKSIQNSNNNFIDVNVFIITL
jgi:hypothetical protein